MKNIDFIDTFHQDIVHDISFDWYGNRIATCSSDRKVKIFYKITATEWKKIYEFTAHDAEVRKVKWAHPDFGSIIATCSYDKSVIVWEEPKLRMIRVEGLLMPKENENNSWIYKTKLLDSKESIEDIKFAPKHLGLMLATASAEGIFRIYEAPDIMNVASWRMIHEENACFYGINSISWNKNPFDPPMLAIACKDNRTSFQKAIHQDSLENNSPSLRIYINLEKWKFLRSLPEVEDKIVKVMHKFGVNDVSWAAINGRSFELIVSAGKDGIIVWYLKYEQEKLQMLKAQMMTSDFGVWKASWNMMATIFASSDEKNIVRIWKSSGDKWRCIGIVKEEQEIQDKSAIEEEQEFQLMYNNDN